MSLLGALFHLPHVYCAQRGEGGANVCLTAPSSQRRVTNTLAKPPLANALSTSMNPISLRDAVKLLEPDWWEPPELAGLQAVAVNVEPSSMGSLHVIFFGRQGVVNGLSKSLLFLGAHLAAHRWAAAGRPLEGPRALTTRERQILDLAKGGLTDPKIGKTLGISTRTVRFHLSNAIRKVGAETRAQLIAKSSQRS